MNGPRSTAHPINSFDDQNIWSTSVNSLAATTEEIPSNLEEAARRLQAAMIRCGCMEKTEGQNWSRRPSANQSLIKTLQRSH